MKREAYRAVNVKRVFIEPLVADKAGLTAGVGIDVSKSDLLVVLRWSDSGFERPWRGKNPEEIPDLIHRLQPLADGRSLTIALESTGTYGDALRQALTDAKLSAHRVSGKAVHDYAEIFDGIPSQHDGKDAAIVAELAALGKSSPWPYQPPTEFDQELEYWVERADTQQRIEMIWLGQLEALLARHWPEATRYLELSSETLLQVLMAYGGPAGLAADPGAAKRLRSWDGRFLDEEKIERFVQVAGSSIGVRQTSVDRRRIEECAEWHGRPSMKCKRRRRPRRSGTGLRKRGHICQNMRSVVRVVFVPLSQDGETCFNAPGRGALRGTKTTQIRQHQKGRFLAAQFHRKVRVWNRDIIYETNRSENGNDT